MVIPSVFISATSAVASRFVGPAGEDITEGVR